MSNYRIEYVGDADDAHLVTIVQGHSEAAALINLVNYRVVTSIIRIDEVAL